MLVPWRVFRVVNLRCQHPSVQPYFPAPRMWHMSMDAWTGGHGWVKAVVELHEPSIFQVLCHLVSRRVTRINLCKLVDISPLNRVYNSPNINAYTLRILQMSWGVKLPPVLRPQGCHERRVWCFHGFGVRILRANHPKFIYW